MAVLINPQATPLNPACMAANPTLLCQNAETAPIDTEYRLGLGGGFDLGFRGLFPPHALAVTYSALDERRMDVPMSVAVVAEAGLEGFGSGVDEPRPEVLLRGGVMLSSTARPSPTVQLRPAASFGWLQSPTAGKGAEWTGGVFLPVRITANLAVAPWLGVSGWLPLDGRAATYARGGVAIEPWLDRFVRPIPPPR